MARPTLGRRGGEKLHPIRGKWEGDLGSASEKEDLISNLYGHRETVPSVVCPVPEYQYCRQGASHEPCNELMIQMHKKPDGHHTFKPFLQGFAYWSEVRI